MAPTVPASRVKKKKRREGGERGENRLLMGEQKSLTKVVDSKDQTSARGSGLPVTTVSRDQRFLTLAATHIWK